MFIKILENPVVITVTGIFPMGLNGSSPTSGDQTLGVPVRVVVPVSDASEILVCPY